MFIRKYWIPITVCIVAIVGVSLYYLQTRPPKEPIVIIKPIEVEKPPPPGESAEGGHWHGDEWHADPHGYPVQPPSDTFSQIQGPIDSEDTIFSASQAVADDVNPTSVSSNPLFKDGVPEHLQCPPELIEVYAAELDPEMRERVYQITAEILEKYNPNRPIAEVWPMFMESEKWYHANADPEGAGISMAANRMDWQCQIVLDYPEVIVLAQEDVSRSFNMRQVELGYWSADFNVTTLPDGRTFREDDDKKYVFTRSSYIETEDGFESSSSTFTFGPSNGDPNAEVIEINLDTISDAELEALQGWDYNRNPYTTGAYKLGDNR